MSRLICAVFFISAGIAHFVFPPFLMPRFRGAAGWGLIVLLIAVFPANIQMLLNARARGEPEFWLWIRLPFQPLLLWWVWSVSRERLRPPA